VLLHEIVGFAARTLPTATGLVEPLAPGGPRRWTFGELDERIVEMASAVAALTTPRERVVVVSDNSADVVALLSAVPRAGCVLVPGNTRLTPADLASMVAGVGAAVVLASSTQLERLAPHAASLPTVRHWVDLDGPGAGGARPLVDLIEVPRHRPHPADERDPAWIIHTSGTTGRPKGATLTHRSLLAAAVNTVLGRGLRHDEVYLFPFPLFHVAAYNVLVHHLARRPVVLLPRFDAAAVLDAVAAERVTSVSLAPTMLAMLLDHPERARADLSSLRQISYGASAMPLDLLRRTLEELPAVGLAQGYGMTELSGNAVFLGPDEHRRAASGEPHLLAAAGRAGPTVELRIADPDGAALPIGTTGEILVRGDQVHAGYWDDQRATAASRHGRWWRTGDLGRVDDDGYLYVVDRLKDIIITGGENVASREVEDVVSTHPDVAAVAVVGEPDERWGERVCAVVVWRDGAAGTDDERAAALLTWTEGRLAGFKRPKAVRSASELPTNASGKVDKRRLRTAPDHG
jgi:acyl-CoA synthetase (AMP-forming)/AMP-acid ligase II